METNAFVRALREAELSSDEVQRWTLIINVHLNDSEKRKMGFFFPDEMEVPTGVEDECRRNPRFCYSYFSGAIAFHQEELVPCIPCNTCSACRNDMIRPSLFSGCHWRPEFATRTIIVDPAIAICGHRASCREEAKKLLKTHAALDVIAQKKQEEESHAVFCDENCNPEQNNNQ